MMTGSEIGDGSPPLDDIAVYEYTVAPASPKSVVCGNEGSLEL